MLSLLKYFQSNGENNTNTPYIYGEKYELIEAPPVINYIKPNIMFKRYNCTVTSDYIVMEINQDTGVATLREIQTRFSNLTAFKTLVNYIQKVLIGYCIKYVHYPASLNDHHKYTEYCTTWKVIQTNNASDVCIMECCVNDFAQNFCVRSGLLKHHNENQSGLMYV